MGTQAQDAMNHSMGLQAGKDGEGEGQGQGERRGEGDEN